MRRFWIFGLLVMGAPAALAAQSHPQVREGFWIGFGGGYGRLGCDGCDGLSGVSGYLALGGTLSQKVRLGVESNGWIKDEFGVTLTQGSLNGVIQFYPSATGGFFLKGGIGVVRLELDTGIFGSANSTGGSALVGIGYDARVGRNFSLTPFFNVMGASYDGGETSLIQAGLGVHWH